MKSSTPQTEYLPGFHLQTLRRKPRSLAQVLHDNILKLQSRKLSDLGDYVGKYLDVSLLKSSSSGSMSRHRIFSKENTFWSFFSQILDADGGCKEAVRKLQAYAFSSGQTAPSSSTAAYCKARSKLSLPDLELILSRMTTDLPKPQQSVLQGRRIVVVDGTGLSMPDTIKNQDQWPQRASQKPGCGFPSMQVCACFDLHSGMLISYGEGDKHNHEINLLRQQQEHLNKNDIFLADKGFCSYYDLSKFKSMEVDSVVTVARRKPISASEADRVIANNDLIIRWYKPNRRAKNISDEEWSEIPQQLELRQIKVVVNTPGFRPSEFYIVTTLLDDKRYPTQDIIDLYYQRWDVELFFRDIKTTMNMDVLRCKTPDMIRKEITMYWIVYNCLRCLMIDAASQCQVAIRRISFKGTLQALRQWKLPATKTKKTQQIVNGLYDLIADCTLHFRPDRSEPRVVKRRPKTYQFMTKPRYQMVVSKSRRGKHDK